MAQYSKNHVFKAMVTKGMVPVFYHPDIHVARKVLKACHAGGVCAFEFTNRGDFAQLVFKELASSARDEVPGMVLGVGSVPDPATAALYIQLGADFVISPGFNPEVARVCNRRLIPYIPGCATVTEIGAAQEAGCDICKVFPGDVLGPSFVKSVLAPMPWSNLMVTGGVKPEKAILEAWFKAGVKCVGMGSQLFPKDAIANSDWTRITKLCEESLQIIEEARAYV